MKRTHRTKELSELQILKEENRNLKNENRSLKRQLKQLKKQEHIFEQLPSNEVELNEEIKLIKCPSCFKGLLKEIDILGRNWLECNLCEYDSRKKK
jgi:hypothetical protein